ncbi:MAG: hypothetical protein SCM11_21075, partial [Bacillota bacterium]|nr:hypothetical protein [Bacillota bacterium]
RQAVMQDLEHEPIYQALCRLYQAIVDAQRLVKHAQAARHPLQRAVYQLNGMMLYCQGVTTISQSAVFEKIRSTGLIKLCDYIKKMATSDSFIDFAQQVRSLNHSLSEKSYYLTILGGQALLDLSQESVPDDYLRRLDCDLFPLASDRLSSKNDDILIWRQIDLCQLESEIVMHLEQFDPIPFDSCREISQAHPNFIDPVVERFSQDFPFYIGYAEFMQKMKNKGFDFSWPVICPDQPMDIVGMYHLPLALQSEQASAVVVNDIRLTSQEKGASITGANQGGKTTFLCSIGQVAWFAALGLPVGARFARLPLFSMIRTHFAKAERSGDQHGKLSEEITAIKATLADIQPDSLILMNELLMSTTVRDACEIGRQVIRQLLAAGATVMIAGHIPDLAAVDGKLANLVAEVMPGPENRRTFKIVRQEPDGQAYAIQLAKSRHLTYAEIKERIIHGTASAVS